MSSEFSPTPEIAAAQRHDTLATLGAILSRQLAARRMQDAVDVANVMLQLDPRSEAALYGKALALIHLKEVALRAQARETLERLLEIDPAHFKGALQLVKVYLAIGPLASAQPLLARLLSERPADLQLQALQSELSSRAAEAVVVEEHAPPGDAAPRRKRRVDRARYPETVGAFDDLRAAVQRYVIGGSGPEERFLVDNAQGFTMGSCFAARIARELSRLGQPTLHMQLAETVNTTFANLEFLRWLMGEDDDSHRAFFEREVALREVRKEDMLRSLSEADFVIYTLGVAPAFFNKASGRFTPHEADDFKQFQFLAEHEYRTSTLEQNLANLREIHALLRKARPGVKLVITVSPVPLSATFEMSSAVVADCVSKSILRAAAHEFMKDAGEGTYYWPSFEMVRWLGGHIGRVFGNDDGNNHHVSDNLVTMIVELFIERFRPLAK
jgi:tetratricopeptide (TPR) repeat protein